MSTPSQCCFAVLAVTLICQLASAGQPKPFLVTINIFNDANVSDSSLATAKREASRVFAAAHVEIRWIDCTITAILSNSSCHDPHGAKHLNLRIVPAGKKQNEDIFGIAFLGADGAGIYSDVFYDAVEKLRIERPINIGRLLGNVMAHEIGHLLIGSDAHSAWGLMCAKWHAQELRHIEMGTLFFTVEQEKLIHLRLNRGSPESTNLGSEP